MNNLQSHNEKYFNPFIPTKRDIDRTNTLSNKKISIVLILGLLLSPLASALYLNRFVNTFQIICYVIIVIGLFGVVTEDNRESLKIKYGIEVFKDIASIVVVIEQSLAVKNAKLRRQK